MPAMIKSVNNGHASTVSGDRGNAIQRGRAAAARPTDRNRGVASASQATTDTGESRDDPSLTPTSDSPTTVATRGTDDTFVRELYAEYFGILLSVVLRLTGGDRYWAEDVVQETLLRAWRNADGLVQRGSRSLMPWLATVARRIVINDHWRGRGARPQELEDAFPPVFAVPDDTERTLQRILIEEALAKLTPAHRKVIVEIYLRGRTVGEVAQMVGIPPGTVKSRAFYAMRIMRAALESRGVSL